MSNKRRAWTGHTPTLQNIKNLLREYPHTTFMAVSRKGTNLLNTLATQALFENCIPIKILAGDIESNPDNYTTHGQMIPYHELKPLQVTCYIGMIFFARNVDKARDFVNGGKATIEFYDEASKALVVLTESGHRIPVRPWTDQNLDNRTYHPIKPGYASTVLKLAGAELPHCVLWLDVPNVPGAACTGMSRVQYSKDLLIGGNLNADHFTPCQG